MTHLRKMMLEELERRNYAQTTIDCYIQTIEDFARHFHRPPDQLTPEHIREYQAYLFRERKLAASTVTQRLAALRFFYTQTIKKAWSVADTPYRLPTGVCRSVRSSTFCTVSAGRNLGKVANDQRATVGTQTARSIVTFPWCQR